MDYTEETRDVEYLITFHCVEPLISKWEMVVESEFLRRRRRTSRQYPLACG